MDGTDSVDIRYREHGGVKELIDVVVYAFEEISLGFEYGDAEHVRGPGLLVVIAAGCSLSEYADPMGDNRWPVDRCRNVHADLTAFCEVAREVALTRDGGVVVGVDGEIQRPMVRLRTLSEREIEALGGEITTQYADWMGSRHMSALDTSVRSDVVTAITLSEEDGRVTAFQDGKFEDVKRDELCAKWRSSGADRTPPDDFPSWT
ncbi:diadenylate cyclase [Halegenticoccus soli]|uniref:diadenylate cyclase n=1 Tax=Halegenticoccus soli TaxID=1985678 RepID=UPI000C6D0F18|nr:diadenylate cyclase [Halegenticoccus soli]